jgi:hypothetical protein
VFEFARASIVIVSSTPPVHVRGRVLHKSYFNLLRDAASRRVLTASFLFYLFCLVSFPPPPPPKKKARRVLYIALFQHGRVAIGMHAWSSIGSCRNVFARTCRRFIIFIVLKG